MSGNTDYSLSKVILNVLSLLTKACAIISIAVYSLQKEVSVPIEYILNIYIKLRSYIFEIFSIKNLFEFIARFFDLNITLNPPWQDIVVLLSFYTMVQVIDTKNRSVNYIYAGSWRFLSGMLGILLSVLFVGLNILNLPDIQVIILGVTIGLMVFRALHPFQIGFDTGWNELISKGITRPSGVIAQIRFIKMLAKTNSARSAFFKKFTSVLKLSVWVSILMAINIMFRYIFPEYINPNSDFLFLILYMATICSFQIFMESKNTKPAGRHIRFNIPIIHKNTVFYSLETGSYRIARDIFKTTFVVLVAIYGGNAISHIFHLIL